MTFQKVSSHAVTVLLKLVTKTMVQVSQRYASHEAVIAISRTGSVPREIVPSLKYFDKQKNIIQSIFVAGTTIQPVFECEEFWINKAIEKVLWL